MLAPVIANLRGAHAATPHLASLNCKRNFGEYRKLEDSCYTSQAKFAGLRRRTARVSFRGNLNQLWPRRHSGASASLRLRLTHVRRSERHDAPLADMSCADSGCMGIAEIS